MRRPACTDFDDTLHNTLMLRKTARSEAPRFQAGFETMQIREHAAIIAELRRRIREADEVVSDWALRDLWEETQLELGKVRLFGDLVLAAFFKNCRPHSITSSARPGIAARAIAHGARHGRARPLPVC